MFKDKIEYNYYKICFYYGFYEASKYELEEEI